MVATEAWKRQVQELRPGECGLAEPGHALQDVVAGGPYRLAQEHVQQRCRQRVLPQGLGFLVVVPLHRKGFESQLVTAPGHDELHSSCGSAPELERCRSEARDATALGPDGQRPGRRRGEDHPFGCPGHLRLRQCTVPTDAGGYELRWTYYPPTDELPSQLREVVDAFQAAAPDLSRFWSSRAVERPAPELHSNHIAGLIDGRLVASGTWQTEASHGRQEVVMLRGENGRVLSRVFVDGLHTDADGRLSVLEVEGGGSLQNNRLMKDLFEALIIPAVGHVAIAVPQQIHGGRPYDYARYLVTAIYARGIQLGHLQGVLLVGY